MSLHNIWCHLGNIHETIPQTCFKVLVILNFTKNTRMQRIVPFTSMAMHEGVGPINVFFL